MDSPSSLDEWIYYWEAQCGKMNWGDQSLSLVEKLHPYQQLQHYIMLKIQQEWHHSNPLRRGDGLQSLGI